MKLKWKNPIDKSIETIEIPESLFIKSQLTIPKVLLFMGNKPRHDVWPENVAWHGIVDFLFSKVTNAINIKISMKDDRLIEATGYMVLNAFEPYTSGLERRISRFNTDKAEVFNDIISNVKGLVLYKMAWSNMAVVDSTNYYDIFSNMLFEPLTSFQPERLGIQHRDFFKDILDDYFDTIAEGHDEGLDNFRARVKRAIKKHGVEPTAFLYYKNKSYIEWGKLISLIATSLLDAIGHLYSPLQTKIFLSLHTSLPRPIGAKSIYDEIPPVSSLQVFESYVDLYEDIIKKVKYNIFPNPNPNPNPNLKSKKTLTVNNMLLSGKFFNDLAAACSSHENKDGAFFAQFTNFTYALLLWYKASYPDDFKKSDDKTARKTTNEIAPNKTEQPAGQNQNASDDNFLDRRNIDLVGLQKRKALEEWKNKLSKIGYSTEEKKSYINSLKSQKQKEVLLLLLEGYIPNEIAEKLGKNRATVSELASSGIKNIRLNCIKEDS